MQVETENGMSTIGCKKRRKKLDKGYYGPTANSEVCISN